MRPSQLACPHGFKGGVGCGAEVCQEVKRCAREGIADRMRSEYPMNKHAVEWAAWIERGAK